jgi:hypothetical protein
VGHVALTGEMRSTYSILVRRPRRRWEDKKDNIKIGKLGGRVWTGFICLRIGTSCRPL